MVRKFGAGKLIRFVRLIWPLFDLCLCAKQLAKNFLAQKCFYLTDASVF